jgi:hypothetical protein
MVAVHQSLIVNIKKVGLRVGYIYSSFKLVNDPEPELGNDMTTCLYSMASWELEPEEERRSSSFLFSTAVFHPRVLHAPRASQSSNWERSMLF